MERAAEAGPLRIMMAVFENNLTTSVRRGENGGRTLNNDFVVRSLQSVGTIEPAAGARSTAQARVYVEPEWNIKNLGVAVFLQDPTTLGIYGGAVRSPVGEQVRE